MSLHTFSDRFLGGMVARVYWADHLEQSSQLRQSQRQLDNNQNLFEKALIQKQQTFEQELAQQQQAFEQQVEQRRTLLLLEQQQRLALAAPPDTAQQLIDRWVALGITREKAQDRLFELANTDLPDPPTGGSSKAAEVSSAVAAETPRSPAAQVGLYALEINQNDCVNLNGLTGLELYGEITLTTTEQLKRIRDLIDKTSERELDIPAKVVEEICNESSVVR